MICPTSTCMLNNDSHAVCRGFKYEKCFKKCGRNHIIQIYIKLVLLNQLEHISKRNICLFVAPSTFLTKLHRESGYDCTTINNPIDHIHKLDLDRKFNDGYIHFIYLGGLNKIKGIYFLMEAAKKLEEYQIKATIDIYGGYESETTKNEFCMFQMNHSNIKYLGKKENQEILDILPYYHFLLIPSFWAENYPTAALEAMSSGTVVIGAKIGGITEILENGRGILYNYISCDDLIEKMIYGYKMTKSEYYEIAIEAYEYVKQNNSLEAYYNNLMSCINKVIKDGNNEHIG